MNSPTNPNGYVLRKQDLIDLRKVLTEESKDMTLIILCDEAYMTLSHVDDGHKGPLAENLYDLGDNALVFSLTGTSKLLQSFGARIGFISLWHQNKELWDALADKLRWLARTKRSFASNVSLQLLINTLKGHNGLHQALKQRADILAQRHDAAMEAAGKYADQGGWKIYPGGGGYFILLDVGKGNASSFFDAALQSGVGVITQGDSNIRLAFSCLEVAEMEAVFSRLAKVHQHQ